MAAGLGFKTFTTGEVLTAGDVNGYLMQGINVFASSSARSAAITSPQEGQYSYLKDTNALEYYDGAAWVGAPVGDITSVTAGTGISGGGSSGAVTITNDMATTITTAGDLIYGTGSGTYTRRGIGSTGQVLTVSGGVPTWATAAGGGSVAYGKTLTAGANKSTTSTSYVAIDTTNLRITATPTGTVAIASCSGQLSNSGVSTTDWRVNCGSGTTYGFQAYNSSYEGTTVFPTRIFVITGLTAGTSYNFDWEWKVNAGTTQLIGDYSPVYPRFQVVC